MDLSERRRQGERGLGGRSQSGPRSVAENFPIEDRQETCPLLVRQHPLDESLLYVLPATPDDLFFPRKVGVPDDQAGRRFKAAKPLAGVMRTGNVHELLPNHSRMRSITSPGTELSGCKNQGGARELDRPNRGGDEIRGMQGTIIQGGRTGQDGWSAIQVVRWRVYLGYGSNARKKKHLTFTTQTQSTREHMVAPEAHFRPIRRPRQHSYLLHGDELASLIVQNQRTWNAKVVPGS